MSYRSSRHTRHVEECAYASGHHVRRAPAPATRRDYTLNHAGRQFRLGPVTFWLSVSALVVMALWSAATATYFAFRDDVLTRLIARQADMQYAYEDRIGELRAQIDRLTSRQLLDQEQVEQRIEQLARRQKALEARTTALSGLPEDVVTGSIRSHPRPLQRKDAGAGAGAGANPKPSPINDTVILAPPPERHATLESRVMTPRSRTASGQKSTSVMAVLDRLEESLDRVEAQQSAALLAIEDGYEAKARRMRSVLADLGVNLGKVAGASAPGGVGGPFVPPSMKPDAGAFERQMRRVQIARANVERLSRVLQTVPVRKPLAGEIDTTSGFGIRLDPFLRAPAMHTGLDFRGAIGEPVRATAAGTVSSAGWNGGYGRMVEIDHSNGFSTRYGHLSEILVREGQSIKPGQVIGRVGSTGRSTGPHLHYETRVEGEAVDPQKFLRAGLRLGEKL
ncbi:MAG: peptidoglycan DD-metalloendopeptidase family protein [Variibacter sp.]|nr:peptidoglycan DD-metalloendopeptidase family protein [Variibacter sp.]